MFWSVPDESVRPERGRGACSVLQLQRADAGDVAPPDPGEGLPTQPPVGSGLRQPPLHDHSTRRTAESLRADAGVDRCAGAGAGVFRGLRLPLLPVRRHTDSDIPRQRLRGAGQQGRERVGRLAAPQSEADVDTVVILD